MYGITTPEVLALCAEAAAGRDLTCPSEREAARWSIDERLAPYSTSRLRTVSHEVSGRRHRKGLHVRRAIADAWIARELDIMVA